MNLPSNISKWTATILLGLVIAIAAMFFRERIINNRLKKDNTIQKITLASLNDSVKTYQSKNGDLIAKLSSVEVDRRNLKESLKAFGLEIKNLRDKNIKWRNITSALKMKLESAGSGETELVNTVYVDKMDTVTFAKFNWNNNYLKLWGQIDTTLKFNYTYETGINLLSENVKKGTVITAYLTDPNAKITTGASITIKKEKKWYQRNLVWGLVGFGAAMIIK